jgi:hypothetical protein
VKKETREGNAGCGFCIYLFIFVRQTKRFEMAEQQVQRSLPRELDSNARLDRAIERFLIYTPVGSAVGLGLSFLFRTHPLSSIK